MSIPYKQSKEIQKAYGHESLDLIRDVIGSDYRVGKRIGRGRYGDVYNLICLKTKKDKKCDRVIKLQCQKYHAIQSEINSQRYFASHDLAPKIFRSEAIRDGKKATAVIVMEKMDGVLTDLLKEPLSASSLQQICEVLEDIILAMCEIEAVHGDLHWDNIGYRRESHRHSIRLILIDFGFSQTGTKCNPRLEMAQLLRSIGILKDLDAGNVDFITAYFRALYEDSYGSIQCGYNTLWRGLCKN